MNNHVRVHVVEPGSSIVVPNTGGVFHGDSHSGEALPFITIGIIALLTMGVIVAMIIANKKKRKVFDYNKGLKMSSSRGRLFALFVLIAVLGLAPFVMSEVKKQSEEKVSAASSNSLSIAVEDVDLDVEVEDKKVFAYTSSNVRVTTPTRFGYDLMVYADTNDLVSADGNKISSMDDNEGKLTDNTWGVALSRPQDQENGNWLSMPTLVDDAIMARSIATATDETSATRIYYGVYVTPDLPYGDYEGPTINYLAVARVIEPEITMVFNSGDAYFDEGRTQKTNSVGYARTCTSTTIYADEDYKISKTDNVSDAGEPVGEYTLTSENRTISVPGADRLIVVVDYGINGDEGVLLIFNTANEAEFSEDTYVDDEVGFGEDMIVVDGNTVTFAVMTNEKLQELMSSKKSGGDRIVKPSTGYYARVYALYDTPNANTTEFDFPGECKCVAVSGEYKTPILENGQRITEWYTNGTSVYIENGEEDILDVLENGLIDQYWGQVVMFEPEVESFMTITYDANGGEFVSYCTVSNHQTLQSIPNNSGCMEEHETSIDIDYRIGAQARYGIWAYGSYGYENNGLSLLGWSENPQATEPEIEDGAYFTPNDGDTGTRKTLYAIWSTSIAPEK